MNKNNCPRCNGEDPNCHFQENDFSKVTRIEVVDHTKPFEDGGGRCYTFWSEYDTADIPNPEVSISVQDNGRTLKVFIANKP